MAETWTWVALGFIAACVVLSGVLMVLTRREYRKARLWSQATQLQLENAVQCHDRAEAMIDRILKTPGPTRDGDAHGLDS